MTGSYHERGIQGRVACFIEPWSKDFSRAFPPRQKRIKLRSMKVLRLSLLPSQKWNEEEYLFHLTRAINLTAGTYR